MKVERIGLRINKDLKDSLQKKADDDVRSLSNYIELVLKNHIISGGFNDNIQGKKHNNK